MINGKIQLLKYVISLKNCFSQKFHLPNRQLAYVSPALTKPCFSQLQSSPGIPCWCLGRVSLSDRFNLLNTVELLVLCALPPLSPPGFLMSLETICEATLSGTYLHWGQTPHVSSLSAAFARQIFIKSQALPEDLGDLFEYCFSSNLGGFLGLWGVAFTCSSGSPFSSKCFISYLCHAREDLLVLLGLWICCLCSHKVWSSSLNLWSLLMLPLMAPWQRLWMFTIIPSVLLRTSTSQAPVQGSNVACSRSLGSSSASFASDSSKISASLPITVSRAKITPHREKWVLSLY